MKLLATIRDADASLQTAFPSNPETRTTARAVLQDAEGNIAIMFVGNVGYHKLPGGGLEGNETIEEGLVRELYEETGCAAEVLKPLGVIEEYRTQHNLLQISHGFLARVTGPKGIPAFDVGEIANNFALLWLPPQEALALLASETTHPDYQAYFINRRETAFLKAAFS